MKDATSNDAARPPVVRAAWVDRDPADAFRIFTDEIGAWWPLPTHGLFGERAGGVFFRDDKVVELSIDGREVVWAEVLRWDPPTRLSLSWHPGRGEEESSAVDVTFEPEGTGTRVSIEHSGWERFGAEAMQRRRGYIGPNAWGYVLDHFADGAEARLDGPDASVLVDAYDRFFDVAEAGGFGPPPEGEWSAEQIVAHVALNDSALLAVCQRLVHGGERVFTNSTCQEPDVLAQWISDEPMADLISRGRAAAQQVVAAVSRLSAEQLASDVHCTLMHDGKTVVDAAIPWGDLAVTTQAAKHLTAHTQQLADLRG